MADDESHAGTAEQQDDDSASGNGENASIDGEMKVEDRRHWTREETETDDESASTGIPREPGIVETYRLRAESTEQKLQEYIQAFKTYRDEQDQMRARLARDVDQRAALKFASMVGELLDSVDDLDLSLTHVSEVPEAKLLADGVRMARDRFLATLGRNGVERFSPDGEPFDPNTAEAMRMDPVDGPELNGHVTDTLRPGYRLGERVIRPARVAVGKYTSDDPSAG